MQTKLKRAQHLSTRDELVKGGDGKPRTAHKLCEVIQAGRTVTVKHAGTFETETFDVRDKVRVVA